MAKTQFKVNQLTNEAIKPLYAVAVATEVAYEFARGYAGNAQTRVSKIERDPKALQDQAVSLVNARVAELQKDAKDAQARFEARVTELQKEARALPKKVQNEIDDTVTELAKTYADLVDRGEKIVAATRAGAKLFLVPPDNCDSAVAAPVDDDVQLGRADTLHSAVTSLETYAEDPTADLPRCPT